jgi:hypothetical protein
VRRLTHQPKLEQLEDRAVPALVLATTALDFGSEPVGVLSPSPRTTTVLNQDPNNVLLGYTPGGANANDFALVGGPIVGQPLGTAPQNFRFAFTPSTLGAESATVSIATTDGILIVSLTGTGTSSVGLASPNLDFGSVPVGTTGPSVRSTALLNLDPNNVLLNITPGGTNPNDFPLVVAPAIGQPLPTTPQTLRFEFTPTLTGTESATYTLTTTDGTLVVSLTGVGMSINQTTTLSLNHSSVSFGTVVQGTGAPPLPVGLWNLGQNVQLLSITSTSPQAGDFPLLLTSIAPGQQIPVATGSTIASLGLQFGFIPSTVGNESTTYTIATSAGDLTVTLTGTGTFPVSLSRSALDFGPNVVGTPANR